MAIRFDYLAKETGTNLVRNPSLTIAAVLTVAVSLALLGFSLVFREGVSRVSERWSDDVEFIVWMRPDATDDQIASVDQKLADNPLVTDHSYVNREATFAEFREYYADTPEIVETVEPTQLPTSYRVVPAASELAFVDSLGQEYEGQPGVSDVVFAGEFIKQLNAITGLAISGVTVVAAVAAVAALLLMYNTIRTAVFARRREVEVMKLVGATNWFVRIPFMLEGLVQGLIGAGLAVLAMFGVNRMIRDSQAASELDFINSFVLQPADLGPISLWLLAAGAAIGAIGSGFAVTRYLDA